MLIMQIHLKNMCVCSPYIVNSPQSEKIIFQSFKHYCPVTYPKSHSMVVVQFLGRWRTVQWMMAQFRGLICTTLKKIVCGWKISKHQQLFFWKETEEVFVADRAGPSQIHFQGRSYCHVVRSLRHVRLFVTPGTAARQAPLSFTVSQSLLKLMSIESVMPSDYLILCHPLLLLPSIFPSIRVFSSESALRIKWLKYWTFSYSLSLSSEYSGLISFRIDWLISLQSKGLSRVFPNTTVQNGCQASVVSFWTQIHTVLGEVTSQCLSKVVIQAISTQWWTPQRGSLCPGVPIGLAETLSRSALRSDGPLPKLTLTPFLS